MPRGEGTEAAKEPRLLHEIGNLEKTVAELEVVNAELIDRLRHVTAGGDMDSAKMKLAEAGDEPGSTTATRVYRVGKDIARQSDSIHALLRDLEV